VHESCREVNGVVPVALTPGPTPNRYHPAASTPGDERCSSERSWERMGPPPPPKR
jgi:hypothetical protein